MNEMREPLLQIENLSTHFHMFKGTVKAVDGVSFSLNQGEILGVVGESGSGKSVTSFSIIGLVDEPGEVKADKIIFDGKDLTALSEQDMMKIRGKDISMIFQDPMTSLNPCLLYTSFLGIFTCEKQIFLLFFLQKWITFKHYTLGRTKIFKLKIIYSKNIHFFCAWPHDIF